MKLYRDQIIKILKDLNLDSDNYLVISGAAMVLLGIKEYTTDIDIAVTEDYYNYLINNYNCVYERTNEFNNDCYIINNIINFGIDYYNNDKLNVLGIPVQTIEDLIKLKEFLHRDKDSSDIELIKKKQGLIK